MRTLLAGDAEGVCSCTDGGVIDSVGEIEAGEDSSDIGEGVGDGDSLAKTAEAKNVIRIAVLAFAVMSSGVGISLIR